METSNGNLYFVPQIDNSKLQADANKTVQSLKTIGTQAEAEGNKMDAVFSKLGKTMTGVFAGISIGNFIQQITQVRANIEMLEISFKTLLGSEEKAASLMNDMRKYALNTPLLLKDIASGAQMLLGFNVEAERVMPILKQIGDISMGSAQRFQSLTLAFSQMSAAGKLMGQDLLQMINAGFNPLTVISQQTGKSVAQLKEDMSQGAINSQMVADAFAAATGEGGKFNGMLDKMSKGLQGMKSNLQGAVEDMFNEVGRNSQGLIAGTLEFATEAVKNYKKVGEALTVLIGVVGAYKAAELASLAIIRTESAEAWAGEATQIKSLLGIKEANANADVQQALAKGYITEAVAAEVIALREEAAVKTTALQLTIEQAAAEIAAATKERAAAEQRRKRAIENVSIKEQELIAITAIGTAQEKAAAVTALDTANVEKNNAVKAKSVATSKVKAAQAKKETAEQAINTLGTQVNTGVQIKNITSTSLLTAAKKALAAITAKLNALLISNPYAIAAAAVAALAYGIYKLVTYQTAAEKAQKNLNKAFAESQAATSAEVTQLNIMYGTLNAAEKGTQAYKQAKDAIQKKYGEYISNIEKETGKVFDLTQGYEELKKAIREAANEKAYQKYIETAADDFQNETSKALEKLRNNLTELYGDLIGQEIYVKIKTSLEDGNIIAVKQQLAAIANEFQGSKSFETMYNTISNGEPILDKMFNKEYNLWANITEAANKYIEALNILDKTTKNAQGLFSVSIETKELEELQAELKALKKKQANTAIIVPVDDIELDKLEKLRNNLMELYGDLKGQEIYVKIKTLLEDGNKTAVKEQLAAIAYEFQNSKVLQDLENRLQNNKVFKEDNVINFSVNFTAEDEARMKEVEDRIKELRGEESGTVSNESNTTVSELTKQIEQGKKDLAELQKSAQKNGYTPNMVEDIQKQEKALKDLIETYQTITGKKYELPDLAGQLKDRTKIIEDYSKALKRATSDEDIEIRAAKIELMPEGYDKEIASINLQYDKLNDINNQRQQQLLDDLNERNRKIWEAANPDKVKAGEEYSSSETLEEALSVSDMSDEDEQQLQLQLQMVKAYADLANQYKEDATAKLNKETLAKYLGFEQQKLAIIEKYATEEAGIVKATDDEKTKQEKIELLNKKKAAEIKAVDDNEFVEVQKSADLLVKIYQRAGDVSSKELKKMLSDTKKLINYLKFNTDFPEGIGITKEQADSVKENLSEIEEKYVNLLELLNNTEQQQQGGGSYMFSGFVNGLKNIKKAAQLAEAATKETDEAARNLLEKGAGTAKAEAIKQLASGAVDAFSGISRLVDSMKELAEATGNGNLGEAAEVLSSIGQNLGAAAQGFATGGWIGAIVGGVTDIIGQTIQSVTKAKAELKKLGDFQTDFARQMLFHSLTLNEDLYENLFGVKSIQKAADAYQLAKKAMTLYNDNPTLLPSRRSPTYSYDVDLKNMVGKMETLHNMQIKVRDYSGWANLWGKEDEYMSLKDLAPDLWNEAGEFDVEAAQIFLDTNEQITDEQRQQIENAIELKEKYDEAMEAVHADLQTYIGTWADDITDIIYNSIIDGGDAFAEWEKTGSKAIVKLGKQLVNQFMIQTYLETFTEQLEATYGIENATERALALGDLFKTMGEGVADNLPMWQSAMKSFFNAMGVDVSALDSNLSGMAASIGGLSEDTGLAIAGAANSIIYYAVGQYNELTTIRQLIEGYTGGMAGTGNNNNIVMSQLLTIQQSALGAMYDIHTLVKSINENTYKIERAFNGVISPINSRSGAKAINVNA